MSALSDINTSLLLGLKHVRDCESCSHRKTRMFCDLTPDALSAFAELGSIVSQRRGSLLFSEGEPGDAVIVLCTGQVKLSCTSRDGKTMILKIAGAGDVLGLSAVVSGSAYEVSAETLETTQIKTIRRQEFLAFLERFSEASMHAAQALSSDYKGALLDARLLALSGSAASRMARVLLDWGQNAACGKTEIRFTMALTHEELGNMAGTSRETTTRLLGKFQKEHLIEIKGSHMLLVAPDKLETLAGS